MGGYDDSGAGTHGHQAQRSMSSRRTQSGEFFDQNGWDGDGDGGANLSIPTDPNQPWKPLSYRIPIKGSILHPYRFFPFSSLSY